MAKQSFYFFFLGTFLWQTVYAAQPARQGCDFGDEGHAEFCNLLTNCIQAVNLNIFDDAFVGGNLEVVGTISAGSFSGVGGFTGPTGATGERGPTGILESPIPQLFIISKTPATCISPCPSGASGVTGALVVVGGVYVGENLQVCGPINTNTQYDLECKRILDATGTNLAVGVDALNNLDTLGDFNNTAVGYQALRDNIERDNTAVGYQALQLNQDGDSNTALGVQALQNNINGIGNSAVGYQALQNNQDGINNVAVGWRALRSNITGINNIALGTAAASSLLGSNNIIIGTVGAAADNDTIRIGSSHTRAFIQGINGAMVGSGTTVVVDGSGQLATITSSKRFKKNIESMSEQIYKLLQLRPVEFTFISDASDAKQYGLIAEEVYEVYPEMVTHDAQGNIYSVNYMALIPVLLKQIQQQEERMQSQQQQIDSLKNEINSSN